MRLLQEAGIASDMRVLDVGCGVGDVSILTAALVGRQGSVIGVDADPRSLDIARDRVRAEGLKNVEFVEVDVSSLELDETVDAAVGRFILMYMSETDKVLRRIARHVRPGGILAFQEYNLDFPAFAVPAAVPLWEQCCGWVVDALSKAGVETKMGLKLREAFIAAGLPAPHVEMDVHLITPEDTLTPRVMAQLLRTIVPLLERFGLATADEIDAGTFADRLHADIVGKEAVLAAAALVRAWSTKPR
jgi:ubiquinone/menaquinone biosynthesis C-methylase UbiE